MVVDGDQVEQMLFGDDGAVAGARAGTLFVDMSTSAPRTARSLAERLGAAGHAFLDAPVTGSSPKDEAGTLTIMVGGGTDDVERARPLFDVMGERVVHAGAAGQGQAVKVLSQGVTAVNCATLAQAITVGRRIGVDLGALLEVMTGGSSDSTMRELKGQGMVDHEIPVLFKLEHMLKDVVLCLEEARSAGASFPFAGLVGELYSAGVGRGLGQEDFGSVLEVVESLTGDAPR
jgi:3-hydroxyisobutyrate dehydrogenase-like beta-hydroxyacid dehydrogenase